MSRAAKWIAALALLAGLGLAVQSCSTTDMEAGLLLGDISAGSSLTTLKRLTPTPERRQIAFTIDGRRHGGDLYLPGEKAKAGLVLVPGAAREGKDDPRLVALATSMARARYIVLVPDIPSLRQLEVTAGDAQPIGDAVRWLAAERNPPGIGIAAISYAVGPAVLAPLDPAAAPQVDFIIAVGGYHDLRAVITFFTTGHFREGPDAPWATAEPNAYGKWVFVKSNARRLNAATDRAGLAAIAERKMADPTAAVDDLTANLTPQGKAVMALLDNTDPERVPDLIDALPPAIRAEIDRLDLARHDLSGLKARLFVLHGRDDRIIPFTEGMALAAAAPKAELVLLEGLDHADLRPEGLGDSYALWRAVTRVLAERDHLAQRRP